jgi:hypothetical protein
MRFTKQTGQKGTAHEQQCDPRLVFFTATTREKPSPSPAAKATEEKTAISDDFLHSFSSEATCFDGGALKPMIMNAEDSSSGPKPDFKQVKTRKSGVSGKLARKASYSTFQARLKSLPGNAAKRRRFEQTMATEAELCASFGLIRCAC